MISKYSIAVLPFVNMSPGNEDEYFSDGITEEIINALSKIEGLHVTARTSSFTFKNQLYDIKEIGQKLLVSFILQGSIRKSVNSVRISVQLIKTESGFHVWSESWERELNEIFTVQDEIASIISEQINSKIKPVIHHKSTDENSEALDLYFRGLSLLNQLDSSNSEQILSYFEQSVASAPKFSKPIVGLCNCYTWLASIGILDPKVAREKIDNYINLLFQLNHNIPDIFLLLAEKNFWIEWKPILALENINKSLELKPSSSNALIDKGMANAAIGRIEEAFDAYFQAERLNPFGGNIKYSIGFLYHLVGDNTKALDFIDQNIEISPRWFASYFTKTEILCDLEKFSQAWAFITELENNPYYSIIIPFLKGIYFAYSAKAVETYQQITIIESGLKSTIESSPFDYYLGLMFLKLGERDKALNYLEHGIKYGSTPFLFIHIDSAWDELRENTRFKNAIQKILLPEKSVTENGVAKYKKSSLSKELIREIGAGLEMLVYNEKPYLNPTLSLHDLSELLDITTNQLSQYLNEYQGKNFYDYINTFRLKHFIDISKNPTFSNLSILGLAYESGFNSKTTFNSFFKKEFGVTPSEFIKNRLQ